MAVNKNFVVKNGLEVSTDLILANATTSKVGIATTSPEYTLHVNGGIGATDSYVSGISTVINELNVGIGGTVLTALATPGIGYSVGVGTASPAYLLDVRSPVSTGQTALYVFGDMRVTGDINLDDINLDDATIQDLTVTQNVYLNSVSGITTIDGYVDINDKVDISETLNVAGITTLASSGGITTTGGDLYVDSDLYVKDQVTGGNLNITGVATIATLYATTGIITATSVNVSGLSTTKDLLVTGISTLGTVEISSGVVTATTGIVTYYGDGSNLSGVATDLTATIGISSGGTVIGTGITVIDYTATNATITVAVPPATAAGVATVNITPSVSLGLVIALGG